MAVVQCRACLTTSAAEYIGLDISSFNQVTHLEASTNDKLPKTLCGDCGHDLNVALNFVQLALQANTQLHDNLNKTLFEYHEVSQLELEELEEECVVEVLEEDQDIMEIMEVETIEEQEHVDLRPMEIKEEVKVYAEDELDDEYLLEYKEAEQVAKAVPKGATKWKCIECKRVLRGDVSYEGHMNIHKNSRPYKCTQCQCTFRCKQTLERHCKRRHQPKSQLNNHLEVSSCIQLEDEYKCSLENEFEKKPERTDASRSMLSSMHRLQPDDKKSTPYLSSKAISSELVDRLNDDVITKEYSEESTIDSAVAWQVCKKPLLRRSPGRKDREVKEGSDKQFLCSYCPRECKSEKNLNKHKKKHEQPNIVYVCKDCGRQYQTEHLLLQHHKQAHKERDNICPICGNAFKLKNQLMNHMKLHLEKNIQCPQCDKKYSRQFDLNVHLRSHTGELPFACHLCEKRFAIKVRLTYHLQKHYGIKHICKDCGSEFNSKQKLKSHSFKHTGMPYRCEHCDNHGFANRDIFKRHLLRVHNEIMSEDNLTEMFQRNTGKATRIRTIDELEHNDLRIDKVKGEVHQLINSDDIGMQLEVTHT